MRIICRRCNYVPRPKSSRVKKCGQINFERERSYKVSFWRDPTNVILTIDNFLILEWNIIGFKYKRGVTLINP